jgi:hypothetical protein
LARAGGKLFHLPKHGKVTKTRDAINPLLKKYQMKNEHQST